MSMIFSLPFQHFILIGCRRINFNGNLNGNLKYIFIFSKGAISVNYDGMMIDNELNIDNDFNRLKRHNVSNKKQNTIYQRRL